MRYLISLLLTLTLSVGSASAQDVQRYVHDFGEYNVYVEVSEHMLMSWRVPNEGNCSAYPSIVEYNGDEIRFRAGTIWNVTRINDAILIEFPNGKRVTYLETDKDPAKLCGLTAKEV